MNIKYFATAMFAAVSLMTLSSCDVIDGPVTENPVVGGEDTTVVLRNVMIEDFTGQKCGNCPAATDLAKQLVDAYGEKRVCVVAVHSGQFAVPDSVGGFPVDYRTPEGNAITESFRVFSNPAGLLNRVKFGSSFSTDMGKWSASTSTMLKDTAVVDLKPVCEYDPETRTITVTTSVRYIKAGTPDYYIVGALTESNIVGDQLDYRRGAGESSHIEGYVFNHVFRGNMNGTWGTQLSPEAVAKGTTLTNVMTKTLPAGVTWNPENMDVVVYVHRYNTTKDVLQVEHVSVK